MIHHLQHIVDLVEICRVKGVQHIVISPGSRNAPLINLFSKNNYFKLHSVVDERSAAYYALGISLATQKAVAILCSSGTAVLNYAPALAEAYYQGVPLIAITADRPEELIDQQDNQTIRQINVFENYVKESIHLHRPTPAKHDLEVQNLAINNIINTAISGIKGPVHINVPIAEPLYVEIFLPTKSIKTGETGQESPLISHDLIHAWNNSSKRMIICGENSFNDKLNTILNTFAINESAIVIAEAISNVKGEKIMSSIDRVMMLIEDKSIDDFQPDLLLTMGGPVVSKRLKLWLLKQPSLKHYRISLAEDQIDTYQNLTATIVAPPVNVLSELSSKKVNTEKQFINSWVSVKNESLKKHTHFLATAPFSDLAAVGAIMNNLPTSTVLHLGNSNSVRYGQLFETEKCNGVYSNRGVSGIDGCLSTAVGFASQSDKMNLVILGELSFLYDSNGLWNKNLTSNLRIVVINNQGGGIFRLISGPTQMEHFEEYIETNHFVNIEKLSAAYGVEYFTANESNLDSVINEFIHSNKTALLEIKTPKLTNAEVYKQYIEAIKNL